MLDDDQAAVLLIDAAMQQTALLFVQCDVADKQDAGFLLTGRRVTGMFD